MRGTWKRHVHLNGRWYVVDDLLLVHPCECGTWKRLWYWVTGR